MGSQQNILQKSITTENVAANLIGGEKRYQIVLLHTSLKYVVSVSS